MFACKKVFFISLFWVTCFGVSFGQNAVVIPSPVSVLLKDSGFCFSASTVIYSKVQNDTIKRFIDDFSREVNRLSGIVIRNRKRGDSRVEISYSDEVKGGREAYEMSVGPGRIQIRVSAAPGVFYAFQTIRQFLPPVRTNAPLYVPAMVVKDYPRFTWRGMHLDVSRHFFSPDEIYRYLDLLATYKINTFHWHLVDDQGWRIEIKKYPQLTRIGAWRVDKNEFNWNDRPQADSSGREKPSYGGYYTQDQIRDIVAYAARKNIRIIPEIEMPGHVASAIASYPWLSCSGKSQLPLTGGDYSNSSSNYCAGNDSVFIFIEDVLSEVMQLFPSEYLHIGGDEVDKGPWKKCSRCQKRIQTEHLQGEDGLQSYFVTRIGKFLKAHNRKMIGWDEILEGGLAPDAIVMSWRGEAGGIEAARMKHEVVMTPGSPCYFDHYQGDPETEPKAIGGFNTLQKVYQYEPVPAELRDSLASFVLGAQANVWAEYITGANHLEYMILPRMPALAEVLWSPKSANTYSDFYKRTDYHKKRWDMQGYKYAPGNFKVQIGVSGFGTKLKVGLNSEIPGAEIRYSTDGGKPGIQSNLYSDSLLIDSSLTIQAVVVKNKQVLSLLPSSQQLVIHKGIGAAITYLKPVSTYFAAEGKSTLINGIRGPRETRRSWHAINKDDMEFVVELPQITSISKLTLGTLQYYKAWVFAPGQVSFEFSIDGLSYSIPILVTNNLPVNTPGIQTKDFSIRVSQKQVKFIRVKAKNIRVCPEGHPGAGQGAWLFADELIIE